MASEITRLAKALEKHTRLANEAREQLARVLAQFGLPMPGAAGPAATGPARMHGGHNSGSPRGSQILEVLKKSGEPMTVLQIESALGSPKGTVVVQAVLRLLKKKQVVRLGRAIYALPGTAEANARPMGRHADVLRLLKRHRIVTAKLLVRELGIRQGNAEQTVALFCKPTPTRPAVLVRVGTGQYAAADSPAALMAGLKEAIKPAGAAKRGRPRKRGAKPVSPENSSPPKPDPAT